ncbi:MAG: ankyrin repeat domain-containing protein [Candidatus Omnitrophota bacterium]
MMRSKSLAFLLVLLFLPAVLSASEVHEAAKTGDLEKLRSLLDKDQSLLYVQDEQGKTPLHWATGRGQLEAMRLLLDTYRVDVNVRNKNNGTPVHVAASQAQPQALEILLRHNAIVDARAKDGATPLHFAAFKRKAGHLEAARILLEHKADVNARMDNGATPLALALHNGNTEMATLLRKWGAKGSKGQGVRQSRTSGLPADIE